MELRFKAMVNSCLLEKKEVMVDKTFSKDYQK